MGGVGSIPLSEIATYAQIYDIRSNDLDFFILAMRVLDSVYMDHVHEKMERESKKKRTQPSRPSRRRR